MPLGLMKAATETVRTGATEMPEGRARAVRAHKAAKATRVIRDRAKVGPVRIQMAWVLRLVGPLTARVVVSRPGRLKAFQRWNLGA
jgi:hypothetical protein